MPLILRIRSRVAGPVFDGRAARAARDFAEDLEELGAESALDSIKDTFHREFKQPTGFYESNVRIRNTTAGPEVWDGGHAGPVYGPWLEGVGSRNNTTRFKGYHAFRKAAELLDRTIELMGERLLASNHIRRMN